MFMIQNLKIMYNRGLNKFIQNECEDPLSFHLTDAIKISYLDENFSHQNVLWLNIQTLP